MIEALLIVCVLLLLAVLGLGVALLLRKTPFDLSPTTSAIASLETSLRGELAGNRTELAGHLKGVSDSLNQQVAGLTESTQRQLDGLRSETQAGSKAVREELSAALRSASDSLVQSVAGLGTLQQDQLKNFGELMARNLEGLSSMQRTQLSNVVEQIGRLTETTERKLEAQRQSIEQKLAHIQQDNTAKLEQMRATVDEKLQSTLNTRLSESFKLVSSQLDLVARSIGEMQAIGNEVGDLKRILGNVKVRGTWGEVQLGALLDQVLTPQQYVTNFAPRRSGGERVEYAIKLPGRTEDLEPVYLPIDVKWPKEDLQRLMDAMDRADAEGADAARRQLEKRIKDEAADICNKYIVPPTTTNFAVLFLPTEGLFAEVIRIEGLVDYAHQKCRVMIAGPTTLCALLNSLQMGFRTLAVNEQSARISKLLAAIKGEFTKYGEVMEKVQEKLRQASDQVEHVAHRARQIDRKLKGVTELPAEEAREVLLLEEKPSLELEQP